jgi:hypothetical protein
MWVGGEVFKKKTVWEMGRKKVPKQNLRSGLRKGKKKVNLLITLINSGTEKIIPSVPHPSRMVHWWVLVHCGWPS